VSDEPELDDEIGRFWAAVTGKYDGLGGSNGGLSIVANVGGYVGSFKSALMDDCEGNDSFIGNSGAGEFSFSSTRRFAKLFVLAIRLEGKKLLRSFKLGECRGSFGRVGILSICGLDKGEAK
jgi:hypothetical protein